MSVPALLLEPEQTVEERVAVLEANIGHIRLDIADMKTDLRRLNDKMDAVDQKLTAKIDGVEQKLAAKIDGVEQKLTAKIDGVEQKLTAKIEEVDRRLSESFGDLRVGRALDRVWWLLMLGALLAVMARGFKWI